MFLTVFEIKGQKNLMNGQQNKGGEGEEERKKSKVGR